MTHLAGTSRWWNGPLDVEGLALGSVRAAAASASLYAGAPGRFSTTPDLTAAAFDSSGLLRIAGREAQGFAPLSGFRQTLDGWIRIHANYPHHERGLLQALGAATGEDVDRALLSIPSLEAEALIQAHGGIAAAVRTREEWLGSAMGRAAGAGPWVELTAADGSTAGAGLTSLGAYPGVAGPAGRGLEGKVPAGNGPTANHPAKPLSGVRVLDLTRVIAGPVATRLLAALGADVLRIDPPGMPELLDQFVDTCFGKRSVEADLANATSRERLEALLDEADVVVTGYRRGALDRFGLEPRALLASRPRLAVVALNSWGIHGPWQELRGFDSIVQAACGIAHVYGGKDGDGSWRPGALPVQALDHATGYGVAAAALTLLTTRRETGWGGIARLSLARTAEELFALTTEREAAIAAQDPSAAGQPAVPAGQPARTVRPEPDYRTMPSSFGELRYVRPPLQVDGTPIDFAGPPPPYGSSSMTWA